MTSKALAQFQSRAGAGKPAVLPGNSPARHLEVAGPSANFPAAVNIETLIARFFRSLHVLVRSVRIYQRNHPRVLECLETVDRDLRAAMQELPGFSIGVETHALALLTARPAAQGGPLPDQRGELRALAAELAGAGITSLTFLARTNLGELAQFAHAVDATSRNSGAGKRNWAAWLTEHKIAGIRVNHPLERREDAVLAGLLSALLGPEPTGGTSRECTAEQMQVALRFIEAAAPRMEEARQLSTQEAARCVHALLAEASAQTLAVIRKGVTLIAPAEGESPASYLARVADALAVDFARQQYAADRARASEIRMVLARLQPPGSSPVEQEAQVEARVELFWRSLPARDIARVLASSDAWCVPVAVVRRYLDPLIASSERKGAQAAGREARRVLADFARCVESEEDKARRATAAGLVELSDLVERLWPHAHLSKMGRSIVGALRREVSPGIAGLLTAATEKFARLALARGAYAELEGILEELDKAPRDAAHGHIAELSSRIVSQEHWLFLVDAALDNRALDPTLARLLRRDPERLLDRLGLLITAPDGANLLPAMLRLVRAAGEPVLGALETHLSEPRRQRIATAVKLLAGVQPERLAARVSRHLPSWDWSLQDLAVTELARQSNPAIRKAAAQAFTATLTEAHLFVVPSMLDHIALADEEPAISLLVDIASGAVERLRDVFVRIKAVEALGHMRATAAAQMLRDLARNRTGLTYAEPSGLRSAAEDALALIESRPASARVRAAQEAVEKSRATFSKPRRYLRVTLPSPMPAKICGPHPGSAQVRTLALGGALLETTERLVIGDSVNVEIHAGLQRIHSTAVVRNLAPGGYGIEFVHMKQEDREKLRQRLGKLLR